MPEEKIKWKCPICGGNKFRLSSHDHAHGGNIPLQCETCTVMFEDGKKFNVYVVYGAKDSGGDLPKFVEVKKPGSNTASVYKKL